MFDLILMDSSRRESILHYTPKTSQCEWQHTGQALEFEGLQFEAVSPDWAVAFSVHPSNPGRKVKSPKTIKIQLGLKCNYACTYCNQRSPPLTTPPHLLWGKKYILCAF